jgi:hypothetical protein
MKKEKKKYKGTSRRTFFGTGILASAAALLGFNFTSIAPKEKEEEKVKLLTSDGKLVEVPKKILTKKSGKAVSNKDLYKWVMESKK